MMRKTTLTLLIIATLIGCTETLDKPLSKEDFEKVKEIINKDESYSPMKRKYVIDNLSMQLGFAELGKAMKMDESKLPTFREQISDLSTDYDSIKTAKLQIRENNEKLKNFSELVDAKAIGIDKYKGYLQMTLKFNNPFDKEILYVILNYKYVDKYDSKYFDENAKLTDQVAGDFKGEKTISTTEQYNRVAEFIYTKVPVKARKELRDQLGEKVADEKVHRDFLLEGLKVSIQGIVFADKSELTFGDGDWEYLD
jgi:TolA-binding protein